MSSSLLYTGSEDGTINLWDLRLKKNCVNIYKGENDSCNKSGTDLADTCPESIHLALKFNLHQQRFFSQIFDLLIIILYIYGYFERNVQ